MNARLQAQAPCAHCGEAFVGEGEYCCGGCSAAADWIRSAGLADYYRLRSEAGNRVSPGAVDLRAWDREDVQEQHARSAGGEREIRLAVEGMRCAACAWLIDRALATQPGVVEARANAASGRLRLRWRAADTKLSVLLERLHALGYHAYLGGDEARAQARREERNGMLLRLGVAALVGMQAMMFAEVSWFNGGGFDGGGTMPEATRELFRWLTLLLCTPVVFWCGQPILAGMRRELSLAAPGMDTLAGSSILLAYGASVVETLRGGPQVWFDAAAMFVLFLLLARVLERHARDRAGERLELLARAQPELAWRRRGGALEQVPVLELQAGDELQVPADANVPADGVLLDDAGDFDEALLSGESAPVRKSRGGAVFAGSRACLAGVRVRVTAVGADTRLAALQALAQDAQERRPALARAADRAARAFVVLMFGAALATFFWWLPQGPGHAFPIALAVLVAACPCALALAVPATLSAAADALARRGVLALGVDAIETLAKVDTVLFDKTGTLTEGAPRLRAIEAFVPGEDVLALAAGLELDSRHPLARAFAADAPTEIDARLLHPGRGVEGYRDGARLRLGRADFATGRVDDDALWLGRNGEALARFEIEHALRADAVEAVGRLRALGLHVQVASGDAADAVARACAQLGIDDWESRLLPPDKLALLRGLQANHRCVLAVGDGLNDAPLLAGADVAAAIGGGSALAQRSADLLVGGERLAPLADAVAIARRARRIMRQNLGWAALYNAVAIAFAASGLIAPGWAALGMAGSSLGVTLNALRAGRLS